MARSLALLLGIILLFGLLTWNAVGRVHREGAVSLPVPTEAKHLQTARGRSDRGEIAFEVPASADLVAFYDEYFRTHGWEPADPEQCTRQWGEYVNEAMIHERSLLAAWSNKTTYAVLAIKQPMSPKPGPQFASLQWGPSRPSWDPRATHD